MFAIQSSTISHYEARLAFDGNRNQNFRGGETCSHTLGAPNEWLQVDLTKRALIKEIIIYYRVDCCSDRFGNANVNVSDSSDMLKNEQFCVHIVSITTPNNIQTFSCKDDVTGQFLRITNGIEKTNLHLCEVQVIGTFHF